MTTVVGDARNRVMVADSRCECGDLWFPAEKIYRVGDELLSGAGAAAAIEKWVDWYRKGKRGRRPILENFEGLILRDDGLFHVDGECQELKITRGFHAIGSGAKAALAALILDHTAEEAVAVAGLVDAGTGGDIVSIQLDTDG